MSTPGPSYSVICSKTVCNKNIGRNIYNENSIPIRVDWVDGVTHVTCLKCKTSLNFCHDHVDFSCWVCRAEFYKQLNEKYLRFLRDL